MLLRLPLTGGVAEPVSGEGQSFPLAAVCQKNALEFWRPGLALPSLQCCVPSWLPILLVHSMTFVLSIPAQWEMWGSLIDGRSLRALNTCAGAWCWLG